MKGQGSNQNNPLKAAHKRILRDLERGAAREVTDRKLERRDRDVERPTAQAAAVTRTASEASTTAQPAAGSEPLKQAPGESLEHFAWRAAKTREIERANAKQAVRDAETLEEGVVRVRRNEISPVWRRSEIDQLYAREEERQKRAAKKEEKEPSKKNDGPEIEP